MPRRLDYPNPGEPISAGWARDLIDTINDLVEEGPRVCAPLAKKDGVVHFDDHYRLFEATTTGTIPARVGTAWKSGPAKFLTVDVDGVESDVGGSPDFTAWNWTGGDVPPGARILVAWMYEKWAIVAADCSGVA